MKRKLDRSNFNNYWTIKRKSAFSGSSLVHLSTYVKRGMMWHLLSRSWLQECQIQQLCAGESDWCLVTLSDSDWTGNKSHRKSTSGGFHALNSCPSFNGSGTLKVISLSSCEAELRAIVSSASDSIYIRSVLEFVTDSTTARQLTMKRIGKVKHLCGKLLGCYKYHQIAAWLTSTPGHLEDKESDFR